MSSVTRLDAGSTDRSHGSPCCCWIGLRFALKLLTFLHCWSPETFSWQLRFCHDPTCSTQETTDLWKVSKGALWREEEGWSIQGCLGSASFRKKQTNSNVVHTGLNIWPSLWKYQHQQCHHHTMLLTAIIITIIVKDIFLLFPCSSADKQRTSYWSIMQIRCWSISIVLVMCRRDGRRPQNTSADEKPDQSTSRHLSVRATLDSVRSSVTVLHTTSDNINFSFHTWKDNQLFLSNWLFTFYTERPGVLFQASNIPFDFRLWSCAVFVGAIEFLNVYRRSLLWGWYKACEKKKTWQM